MTGMTRPLSPLVGRRSELAALVRLTRLSRWTSYAALLPAICRVLPSPAVTAALSGVCNREDTGAGDPVVASVLIADSVIALVDKGHGSQQCERLAGEAMWRCWSEVGSEERIFLLDQCCELAKWVSANLQVMDPWEFVARLERYRRQR